MMNRLCCVATRLSAAAMLLFATFAPVIAWAQEQTKNAPPQPRLLKSSPPWLGMAVMFVLLALVIAVSIMPSKRSHQD